MKLIGDERRKNHETSAANCGEMGKIKQFMFFFDTNIKGVTKLLNILS